MAPNIVIEAELDDRNLTRGTAKVRNSVLKISRAFGAMSGSSVRSIRAISYAFDALSQSAIASNGAMMAAVAGPLILLVALGTFIASSISEFYKLDGSVQGLKDSFADLKNAFAIAFAPLVTFAIPYIQMAISWLIKLFNTIAMITGALLGQTQVWQAVEGGTAQAAANAAALGKNTKKAKKEAEGALAAFDQINVLQKKTAAEAELPAGAGAAPTGINTAAFKMTPITSDILNHANAIRGIFAKLWEDLKKDPRLFFQDLGIIARTVFENIKNDLLRIWGIISPWVQANVTGPIGAFFSGLGASISAWFIKAVADIQAWWIGLPVWFRAVITDPLKTLFLTAFGFVAQLGWNTGVAIRNAFGTALDWIRGKWQTVFSAIGGFTKSIFNSVIDILNGLLSRMAFGINSVLTTLNMAGALIPGFQPIPTVAAAKIPYLASGAVIPPNSKFLAMLGDQRHGVSVEAPLDTIVQAMQQALASSSFGGGDITITMPVYLDNEKIFEGQKRIQRRHGGSLIVGS